VAWQSGKGSKGEGCGPPRETGQKPRLKTIVVLHPVRYSAVRERGRKGFVEDETGTTFKKILVEIGGSKSDSWTNRGGFTHGGETYSKPGR